MNPTEPKEEPEVINVGKASDPVKSNYNTNPKSNGGSGEKLSERKETDALKKDDHLNTNENLQPPSTAQNQPVLQGQPVQPTQPGQPAQPGQVPVIVEVPDLIPTKYVGESGFEKELPNLLKKYGTVRPTTVLEKEIGNSLDTKKSILDQAKEINKTENKELNAKEKETDKLIPNPLDGKITVTTDAKDNPLVQLHAAKVAYIDQFYRVSDLFVCCPLHYRYHISLGYSNNQAYHLFDTKEYSPVCSHDCCPNQSRQIDVEIDGYTVEEHKKQKFLKLHKPFRCACLCFCACCTRPTLLITNMKTQEQYGKIIEIRPGCDPTMHVYYKQNKKPSWKIVGSCCQCGYCCKSICPGTCTEAKFGIYRISDEKNLNMEGKIFKKIISGFKLKPDVEQIQIEFPQDINPEEKANFIAAGLLIGYLYYQNISNGKRCHNVEEV